jgi:uncharacterized protein (DUF2252 family)
MKDHVEIAIRDFDQTVIGNPAHDLIRLGLSLATAVRGSDLPGVTTANTLENLLSGNEEALSHRPHVNKDFHRLTAPLKPIMKRAIHRRWGQLAQDLLEDDKPSIPLGKRFWPLSREEKREIERFFTTPEACKIATCLRGRKDTDKVHVLDAAFWVKGCSSLGRLRCAVVLGIGKHHDRELCLMDIKEAVKPSAPRKPHASMPRNPARRVLEGAHNLSPFLGNRMMAGTILDKPVVMRELLPADLKLELAQLTSEEATAVAHHLGGVLGEAHGRQMKSATRRKWTATLKRNRPRKLETPSWLWRSVVDLLSIHDAAYLEHCRLYAATARS